MSDSIPVSVVMPVRNAGGYIDSAIASVLDQSHRELELVVGDDGSTDDSRERIESWCRRDSRVKLHHVDQGLGPAGSSNWVVRLASHDIVARMDADDLSKPGRLAAQLAVLEAHPEAVLVGTLCEFIDRGDRALRPPRRSHLRDLQSQRSPFPHGSIMFRRRAFERAGGYRPVCDFWEDQDLYWRMAEVGALLVLPQVHYAYRYNSGQTRLATHTRRVLHALDLNRRCCAAREQGKDHDQVVAADSWSTGEGIEPYAFRALATLQLMSGRRPAMLGKLLREGRLGLDRESATALAWCAVGGAWPSALRLALRAYAYGREALLGATGPEGPMVWSPQLPPAAAVSPEKALLEAA